MLDSLRYAMLSHKRSKNIFKSLKQCCGSKYIEFGSRSRILALFGAVSRSGSRVILSILKYKIKNDFRYNQFSLKTVYFFKTIITKCNLKKFVLSWVFELWIFILNLLLSFNLYLHMWIRICIPNTNPDPESSWIRIQIRIYNTSWQAVLGDVTRPKNMY